MPCILHIEDNRGDVMLTKEALSTSSLDPEIVVAYNGLQGLEYLQSADVLPDLILLDINMPVMNGKEFLTEMKQDERFRNIPVVILTTSENSRDIRECYALRANAFVQKTIDFDSFFDTIQVISEFWLKHNVVDKS